MDCSGEEKGPSRPLSRGELLKRAGILGAAAAVPVAVAPRKRPSAGGARSTSRS